jgi:ATP-dependent Zn protease
MTGRVTVTEARMRPCVSRGPSCLPGFPVTRGELLDRLAVMLGGRATEIAVFNEISTGAKNDLDKATELARNMAVSYGMSQAIGPLSLDRGGPLFHKKEVIEGQELKDLLNQYGAAQKKAVSLAQSASS